MIGSCTTPAYLPTYDKIDISQYGSYIQVYQVASSIVITGELIAIDSNSLVVLSEMNNKDTNARKPVIVPLKDVNRFTLLYAQPRHYGWAIPVYSLATISHGFFAIFTLPFNLIVTFSTTVGGEKAFKYSSKNMTYDKLKMFARFPQGIPSEIVLADIK